MSAQARSWVALSLPPAIWFVFEQGLSVLDKARCGERMVGVIWGLASIAICLASVWFGRPFRDRAEADTSGWLSKLQPAFSGMFCLAIGFQILAVATVPVCTG